MPVFAAETSGLESWAYYGLVEAGYVWEAGEACSAAAAAVGVGAEEAVGDCVAAG